MLMHTGTALVHTHTSAPFALMHTGAPLWHLLQACESPQSGVLILKAPLTKSMHDSLGLYLDSDFHFFLFQPTL